MALTRESVRPSGNDGTRFDLWVAWIGYRQPAQLPIEAYRTAKQMAREQRRPPADRRLDPQFPARLNEVLDAALAETIEPTWAGLLRFVVLNPFLFRLAIRIGAWRLRPMMTFIPEQIRPFIAFLLSALVAGISTWFGVDLEFALGILGLGSAAQVAMMRQRLTALGSEGWKTWTIVILQILVNVGGIVAFLTGQMAVGALGIGIANQIINQLSQASLTQAVEKVAEQPPAEVALNVKAIQIEKVEAAKA